VLVDGRVSATWKPDGDAVEVKPLRPFSQAGRAAVTEEGEELVSFLSDKDSREVLWSE